MDRVQHDNDYRWLGRCTHVTRRSAEFNFRDDRALFAPHRAMVSEPLIGRASAANSHKGERTPHSTPMGERIRET
jgi:hypothetical protein